jgi:hypothetical protein
MIFGDDAVSAMYRFINANCKNIGIDKGCTFKYERPQKLDTGIYIVVNHLPFVQQDEINEGVVNVNIHVPKTASNEPNTSKLVAIAKNLVDALDNASYMGGAYFEFYSDSRPTADNDDTYYINLKFNVTYNNLKN